jgi:HSP20 family protein
MDTDNKGNIPVKTNKKQAPKNETNEAWPVLRHPILEMERAFDRLFGRSWPTVGYWNDVPVGGNLVEFESMRMPSLDEVDRDNEVLVRAEIPGIEKKDIYVSLTDNLLTIKGQSNKEEKEEKSDYYRHEISSSSFSRSVTVPANVDATKTVANLKDGVLEIKLPKVEAANRRNITVM